MIKKLKLIGSGNENERNFFILNKEDSFFSLFPIFLISIGFRNIGNFESYQDDKPDLASFKNKIDHFKNNDYDIDIIYTEDRIILIIRTDMYNRDKLIANINKLVNYKNI